MDKDDLQKCIEARMSQRELAGHFSCSQTNIRYWLRRFDLKTNPRPGIGRGGKGCEAHGQTKCPHCYRGGSLHVTKRRRKLKSILIRERGGRCEYIDCPVSADYNFDLDDLEFHHLDKTQKLRNLSNWSRSEKEFREEGAKCMLVCALCHRIIERTLRGQTEMATSS